MNNTGGDTGLIALVVIGIVALFSFIHGLILRSEQKGTNARLRKIDKTHNDLIELKGEIKVMGNQVNTIFQHQVEKDK